MLIRIVRMTFKPEEVDNFLTMFDAKKELIRNFPGCQHLELLQDYHQSNIFSTYSIWDDDIALDQYRHSELFKNVWIETKSKFSDKPFACSSKEHTKVC